MPHTIHRYRLEAGLKILSSSVPSLLMKDVTQFIARGFFEPGSEEKMTQFRKDYLQRNFLCEGKSLADYFPGKPINKIRDDEILAKLSELFGGKENANAIIEANTQAVGMVTYNLLLAKIRCPSTVNLLEIIQYPNEFTQVNIVRDKKSNTIKLMCTYSEIPILFADCNGAIPGPITSYFSLIKRNDQYGYQLDRIETDNEIVKNILLGTPTPFSTLIDAYKPALTDQPGEEKEMNSIAVLTTVALTAFIGGGLLLLSKKGSSGSPSPSGSSAMNPPSGYKLG